MARTGLYLNSLMILLISLAVTFNDVWLNNCLCFYCRKSTNGAEEEEDETETSFSTPLVANETHDNAVDIKPESSCRIGIQVLLNAI